MSSTTTTTALRAATTRAAKENDAWHLVCTRERGERYYSEAEIAKRAGASRRNVDAMVARFRLMRRAGVEIDMQDWTAARLSPMPTPGAMSPATA